MIKILTAFFLLALGLSLQAQISFTNSTTLTVGSRPDSIAAVDVNGDGKVDLISADYNGGSLTVLTNKGNGTYAISGTFNIGNNPRVVVAADVNGDGKPDLITANYNDGNGSTLSVLTNSGGGRFVLSSSPTVSGAPFSVAAVDVNSDGKVDLVSANNDNNLTVLTNNGVGGFSLASTPAIGGNPRSVIAFTNVNGKVDLITANQFDNNLSLLTNNGSGGFALAAYLTGASQPFILTTADVNADGRTDIISGNYGNDTLSVWTNTSSGGFLPATSMPTGSQPYGVTAADVNSDGMVDLISANFNANTLTVLTNNRSGGFGLAGTFIVGSGPIWVASADINNDGRVDLISANYNTTTLTVLSNTTPFPSPFATGGAITSFGFVVSVTVSNGGFGYTNTPAVYFGGPGTGAGAVAIVSNGVVIGVTITNNGSGYTNTPLVFIDPPFIPRPILNIAPMSFLSFSNLAIGGAYQLQKAQSFFWTNLPVNFTSTVSTYTQMVAGAAGSGNYRLALVPVPNQAFATSTVSFGFVVHVTVTSGGTGYVINPPVSIIGGGGTNATATSQISGGVVTNINISNPGTGYTTAPTVVIGQPPVAAITPAVLPVMRLDSSVLAPYHNYQNQFKAALSSPWANVSGGLFIPTNVTNSQYIFITNDLGFFRLQFVP